jgi:lysozyme
MDSAIALKLRNRLKLHEGFRRFPYLDSKGNLTIGWGRNLKAVGVSETEAEIMLGDDVVNATAELYRALPWTQDLDDPRKCAFIELSFNMGVEKLLGFSKMINFAKAKEWKEASAALLDSNWDKEVGSNRAQAIAYTIEFGVI